MRLHFDSHDDGFKRLNSEDPIRPELSELAIVDP